VRDVPLAPSARESSARPRGDDHPLRRRKLAEIERIREEALIRVGEPEERELLLAGVGLYAGDGSKTEGQVKLANADPRIIAFFCAWLRRFFEIDESRLGVVIYLHEGLDLDAATAAWARVTGVPPARFGKPYRAVPDATIRHNKHRHGCAHVRYTCTRTQREILALMDALLGAEVWLRGPGSNRRHFG
jgi:hypothetical protein